MGHEENQEPTSFMPVISRLDRLDRLICLLEEKHSLSRDDFCGNICADEKNNNYKECKTLSSALEEVQHKGTLIERLTLLENRVLQLSLEMDEGNASKSSSSTVQTPEKDPPTLQPQERASSGDGTVTEITAQNKSRGKKRKTPKKWLGFFRLLSC